MLDLATVAAAEDENTLTLGSDLHGEVFTRSEAQGAPRPGWNHDLPLGAESGCLGLHAK